jgi:hypothetical protein
MAELGKQYESVCSTLGKQNFVQPYMWLGIEDPEGKGIWRDMVTKKQIEFAPWDRVSKKGEILFHILIVHTIYIWFFCYQHLPPHHFSLFCLLFDISYYFFINMGMYVHKVGYNIIFTLPRRQGFFGRSFYLSFPFFTDTHLSHTRHFYTYYAWMLSVRCDKY